MMVMTAKVDMKKILLLLAGAAALILSLILLLGASLPCFTAARGILPLIDTLIRKE